MIRFGKIFSRCLVLFFASSQTLAQVQPPQDMEASCRKFVQQFYDWYLPRAKDEHSVIRKTESYWAEVSCVFPGPNPDKSQIMPELIFQQGRWLFVNFHYHFDSGDDNLLNILKKLRKDRQEPRDHR